VNINLAKMGVIRQDMTAICDEHSQLAQQIVILISKAIDIVKLPTVKP
jgi:hypothetical protein